MASVVYLTNHVPTKVVGDLMLAGHRAWECLSVAEALYICEREWIDAIVIAADVEDPEVVEAQVRRITLRLNPGSTSRDLICELALLFTNGPSSLQ